MLIYSKNIARINVAEKFLSRVPRRNFAFSLKIKIYPILSFVITLYAVNSTTTALSGVKLSRML